MPQIPASRRDALCAVGVGLCAELVYWKTLYPGLVGDGDTPKFQYLGHILGTAHNPGYPLFILLSHLFGLLPVGSLGYRINLMASVFGAIAVGLAFLVVRRLGAGRVAAASASLGLAFGPVFWSQSLLAEVYTLGACLLLGALLCLLQFGETGEQGELLAALGFMAAGIAHHHADMVTVAPAVLLYVLSAPRERAARPKTLLLGALVLASGLLPYLFIVVRTRQHAPYLGSVAHNLGDLVGVLSARQFTGRLFVFSLQQILTQRVPLLARLLLEEVGPLGTLLFVLGLVSLALRRPREALLLTLGPAGVVFFALNYGVPDIPVFLIPAFLPCWAFVGLGIELVFRFSIPLGGVVAVALPLLQLTTQFRSHDHHRHTFEMRYFEALFEAIPDQSAFVAENYTVDQLVLYEIHGEEFGRRRKAQLIPRDPASVDACLKRGCTVWTFEKGREELARAGYLLEPFPVPDRPLESLAENLGEGSTLLLAGLPGPKLTALLHRDALSGGCLVSIGTVGMPGAVMLESQERAEVRLGKGDSIGQTEQRAPVALSLSCSPVGAVVQVAGREVGRSRTGLVVVSLDPSGATRLKETIEPGDSALPFDHRPYPLYRVRRGAECAESGADDSVLHQAAEGRLLVPRPPSSLAFYLASSQPLSPRLVPGLSSRGASIEATSFEGRAMALRTAMEGDHLSPSPALLTARRVYRVAVSAAEGPVALEWGGILEGAWSASRVEVCGLPAGGAEFLTPGHDASSFGPRDGSFYGPGWAPVDETGERRRMASPEASLIVPLARVGDLRLSLRVWPGSQPLLTVAVNGRSLHECALPSEPSVCSWETGGDLWRLGLNEIVLGPPGGGAGIEDVRMELHANRR